MRVINIAIKERWYVLSVDNESITCINRQSVEFILKRELQIPEENIKYAMFLVETEGRCVFAA